MASNEISLRPDVEPPTLEPFQALAPSCLALTSTLLLEASILVTQTATQEALIKRIADIIASYRISGPTDRYADTMEPKMLDTLRSFVAKQEPVNMVMPAYPFKSSNRESKVLGPNPDVGERMSLQHLNSIGARIQQIYPPGGHITIISDGFCYNDLVGVSDEDVFAYAKGLHRIAKSLGLKHLKFADIFELIGSESPPCIAENNANRMEKFRDFLVSFLPPGYDFDDHIKKDPNALETYRGYIKFLELDLEALLHAKDMSKNAAKRYRAQVARRMITRGKAFSIAVERESSPHIRLSIHASDNSSKLSVALLPHKRYSTFPVTPWHNVPYMDVMNNSLSLGRRPKDSNVTYRVCKDDLGLDFLYADVAMYRVIDSQEDDAVQESISLTPLYPCGVKIQVPKDTPVTRSILNNVTELAKLHSPIIVEGLDPTQHAKDVTDDFGRVTSEDLSLNIILKGVAVSASVSKAASYFVGSTLHNASTASESKAFYHDDEEKVSASSVESGKAKVESHTT